MSAPAVFLGAASGPFPESAPSGPAPATAATRKCRLCGGCGSSCPLGSSLGAQGRLAGRRPSPACGLWRSAEVAGDRCCDSGRHGGGPRLPKLPWGPSDPGGGWVRRSSNLPTPARGGSEVLGSRSAAPLARATQSAALRETWALLGRNLRKPATTNTSSSPRNRRGSRFCHSQQQFFQKSAVQIEGTDGETAERKTLGKAPFTSAPKPPRRTIFFFLQKRFFQKFSKKCRKSRFLKICESSPPAIFSRCATLVPFPQFLQFSRGLPCTSPKFSNSARTRLDWLLE